MGDVQRRAVEMCEKCVVCDVWVFTSVYKCKKTTTGLLAQTRLPFDSKKVSSEEERFKRESCV